MAKKRRVLDRESLLSNTKLNRMSVDVDGGVVYVREMTGKSLLEFNEKITELQKENPELTTSSSLELMALLVTKTACDDEGNLLFTQEDVSPLMDKSVSLLTVLSEAAMRVSGISEEAIAEAKDKLKNAHTDSSTSV